MPIVPVKCTECGAALEIDDTKEAAICQYCNMPFVVEKAVNNYTVSNNISASVVNVYGDVGNDDAQVALGRIKTNLRLENQEKALKECEILQDVHPESYIGWWEAAKIKTDFYHPAAWDTCTEKIFNKVTHNDLYQKAMLVANDEEKAIIQEELAEYNEFIRVNALKQANYQRDMFERLRKYDVSQLDGYCGELFYRGKTRFQYKFEHKNGRTYRVEYMEEEKYGSGKWKVWTRWEIMSKEGSEDGFIDLFMGYRRLFTRTFAYNNDRRIGTIVSWIKNQIVIMEDRGGEKKYCKPHTSAI